MTEKTSKEKSAGSSFGSFDKLKAGIKQYLPLIYLVLLMLALRWTVVEPYVVPTGSMEPTLKTGDRLYALKCAYDIRFPFTNWILFRTGEVKRGDVILFIPPHEPDKTYVKRAIGLPGDQIEVRNGIPFVNGIEVGHQPLADRSIMYDIDGAENKSLFIEKLDGVKHYMILDNAQPSYRNHPPRSDEYQGLALNFETRVPPGFLFAMGDNRDHSFDSRGWGFVDQRNLKGKAMFIWFSSWGTRLRPERIGTLIY